jgi:hypothetical protein
MKRYILIIIFLPLSGCFTPASVFTLTPSEPDVQWIDGIGFVNKNAKDISIQVGYVERQDNLLSFNLFIENISDRPVLVDPAKFKCAYRNCQTEDCTKLDAGEQASFAVDPERQIQQLDIQISHEIENYRVSQSQEAVGGVLSLILSIASIGEEKSEEQIQREEENAEDNERRKIERENEHINRIDVLENQKSVWETQALRKTILLTNQTIEGNVYFKAQNETGYLQLRFPMDSTNFEILFKQEKIQP